MKSILIVTEAFTAGGLETHIRGEIISLSRFGYRIHLVVGSQFAADLIPECVVSVTNGLAFGPEATVDEFVSAVEKLRELIKLHSISYVHLHPFTTFVSGFVAAELERIPVALTLHGPASFNSHYGTIYDFLLKSVIFPESGLIVAVSEEVAQLVAPYVKAECLRVIPNGVNSVDADENAFINCDSRWLVVSRLDDLKVVGIFDFVEKAKIVGIPGVLIAGDGPAKDWLQLKLQEAGLSGFVNFLGFSADVPHLITSCAGVAGMGRVVIEGIAQKKPVFLVGYDGLKGFVDERMFEEASHANFSGRNLQTIDAGVFSLQYSMVNNFDLRKVFCLMLKQCSEEIVWSKFHTELGKISFRKSTILGGVYSLIRNNSSDLTPFLQSSAVLEKMMQLSISDKYFDHKLVASIRYFSQEFDEFKQEQLIVELQKQYQIVMDLNNQVLNLNNQVLNLNNQVLNLNNQVCLHSDEVVLHREEVDSLLSEKFALLHSADLQQQELIRLSNWAMGIDKSPLLYGIKRLCYVAAKKMLGIMPINSLQMHLLRQFLHKRRSLVKNLIGFKKSVNDYAIQQSSTVIDGILSGHGRDVFLFSVIDWGFRVQRPQHLARSFSKLGRRVFFFSNHFVDSDVPGYQIERIDPVQSLYQVKLHVNGAPAIYFAPPAPDAERMIEAGIAKLILDCGATSSVSILQHSFWYRAIKHLPNTYRVYDCMDHHEGFGNVPEQLIEIEKDMLREADLVVVTSSWLEQVALKHNSNVVVIRNAGEYEYFSRLPTIVFSDPQGRKIIGYYGAIAEWFDLDLIVALARRMPECLILLVGADTIGAKQALADLPNVEFTGEVPYGRLPYYLYSFDVCLLPFKVIPLTLATNPVKVYEYLASGKPIVCVDLPEIAQFGDLVFSASDSDGFLKAVYQALICAPIEDVVDMRRQFAKSQTWEHRVTQLDNALSELSFPKISVIVLTYNNLELTKACLDSLISETDYPNIEIIIVDNASSDGTPDYLYSFSTRYEQVKIILNDSNRGFAAGNNIGLAAAVGDYLVVLNNDTIVTKGWALTMLRHFQDEPDIGLVGPVTNNIGNEAKVEIKYCETTEMPREALQLTLKKMGRIYPMRNVAFFCVMMPRAIYEECGPICEDYGRGFFEDDDYCRRVEAVGKRIVCAEDVFIHHHLSASFNKLKAEERRDLFERNRKIYEKKWGEWRPHAYRNS